MKGSLVISLEPPYIGFTEEGRVYDRSRNAPLRPCSVDEVKSVLKTCGGYISKRWSLGECFARIQCSMSEEDLVRLNLR